MGLARERTQQLFDCGPSDSFVPPPLKGSGGLQPPPIAFLRFPSASPLACALRRFRPLFSPKAQKDRRKHVWCAALRRTHSERMKSAGATRFSHGGVHSCARAAVLASTSERADSLTSSGLPLVANTPLRMLLRSPSSNKVVAWWNAESGTPPCGESQILRMMSRRSLRADTAHCAPAGEGEQRASWMTRISRRMSRACASSCMGAPFRGIRWVEKEDRTARKQTLEERGGKHLPRKVRG